MSFKADLQELIATAAGRLGGLTGHDRHSWAQTEQHLHHALAASGEASDPEPVLPEPVVEPEPEPVQDPVQEPVVDSDPVEPHDASVDPAPADPAPVEAPASDAAPAADDTEKQ